MVARQSIYRDTNAIIALVEGPEDAGRGLQDFLLGSNAAGTAFFNIGSLCFAELLVIPYRQNNMSLAGEYLHLAEKIDGLNIHTVSQGILDAAALLRAKLSRLKLPDAIHLATASVAGCQYFLIFDKDFVDLQQMSHPMFDESVLSPVKIVRPDLASLHELTEALDR